jgi:hypothetical protein
LDFIDYREKLGLSFNDRELENMFFNRIFNVLDDLTDMNGQISTMEYFHFCRYTGYPMQHGITAGEGWGIILRILHKNVSSVREFLPYYMFMINCQEDAEHKSWTKEELKNLVRNCLIESHIPCEVYEENGSYFVFPKGAEELDKALVSEPLMWVKDYPDAHKAFVKALKAYSGVTEENASDIADLFRKALEAFFQEFFGGGRSLEKYVEDRTYEKYLDAQEIPSDLRGEFENTVKMYSKFINNNAKHHDKTSKSILEYVMYQTGNIIRLLITLEKGA